MVVSRDGTSQTAPLRSAPAAPEAPLPRISVVTPSYNQARFLPHTMASVLGQNYPNLEYVVIDGASTDGSADEIRKRRADLAHWVSEPDAGQYDAINKGFDRTTGEVMAWLNSDDLYTPWALRVVGEVFRQLPEVEWVTTLLPLHWDEHGVPTRCRPVSGYSKEGFFRGHHLPRPGEKGMSFIQQESTFWRRSLWERAGGRIDSSLQLAGDFELWARFFEHANLYGIPLPLGGFRRHGEQKTAHHMQAYFKEAEAVLARHGARTESPKKLSSALRRIRGVENDSHHVCVNRAGRWSLANRWL